MSLLDQAMEDFYLMNEIKEPDGYGSFVTTWKQTETPFRAAIVFDTSISARVAEAQGVKSVYTITTRKNTILKFKDVLKRASDGKIFRVTSDGDDKFSPKAASLDMRQVTAEEWELIT